ncbi:MAG: M28 family peptidase [Leptolyngbya sp. IPPAS B-1204]|nr:MAG: M28 family peptidase [Leptolyngbya sp. IPPAS B-1204]
MAQTPAHPADNRPNNQPDNQLQIAALKQRLTQHLQQVARERDPYLATAGHFYVQHYIQHQLSQWGTVEQHSFEFQGQRHQNLILNLPPASPASSSAVAPILVGAHYDAVPGCPGADDNATGIAVLLELARHFAHQPTRYPLRLVAFDLEEFGLVGSTAYAVDLHQQKQSLRLMISLEMLGYCSHVPGSQSYPPGLQYFYPNRGNFVGLIGNWRTIPDLLRLNRAIRRTGQPCEWLPAGARGKIVPDTRRSDHAPFWDRGYRAIMVTDTANLRNPHYHRSSDRLETLDLDFLTNLCWGLIGGLSSL